jgi:sugar-specific transcriptional regulator TrmB
MKNIINTLTESLGFSAKKNKVYLALLELGETEASTIAKKSGLKRTTVYNILPELVSEGLVVMSMSKGKKIFSIESPLRLSELVTEKQNALEKIMPDLAAMQSLFFHKPKISILEGDGALKEVYRDFILSSSSGDTVLSYAGTREHFRYVSEDFLSDYMQKRIDKKIKLKLISGSSFLSEELKKNDQSSLRETKITDSQEFDFSGEVIIYTNKVAFISYKQNFFSVIIESKEISAMCRATFNLLWERLL